MFNPFILVVVLAWAVIPILRCSKKIKYILNILFLNNNKSYLNIINAIPPGVLYEINGRFSNPRVMLIGRYPWIECALSALCHVSIKGL